SRGRVPCTSSRGERTSCTPGAALASRRRRRSSSPSCRSRLSRRASFDIYGLYLPRCLSRRSGVVGNLAFAKDGLDAGDLLACLTQPRHLLELSCVVLHPK